MSGRAGGSQKLVLSSQPTHSVVLLIPNIDPAICCSILYFPNNRPEDMSRIQNSRSSRLRLKILSGNCVTICSIIPELLLPTSHLLYNNILSSLSLSKPEIIGLFEPFSSTMRVPYWLRLGGQPRIFHFVTMIPLCYYDPTFSVLMLDGCLAHFWTSSSMKNESNCFSCTDSPCRCLRVKTVCPGDCEEVRYYSYAMPNAHTQNPIQRRTLFPFKCLRFGSMSLCSFENLSDKP